MSLHIESHGTGAPLVLIHGWGMNSGVWDNVVPALAQRFRVHCVDLPGHGYSTPPPILSPLHDKGLEMLDAIVDALSAQFDEPLNVCGWSLGGMVALRWAHLLPQQVLRLVLVAGTPCFTARKGWLCGMEEEGLQQFSAELEQDHVAMLRRFVALLVRGSTREREQLIYLRFRLLSRGEPEMNSLLAGLEILRDVDLRAALPCILQPALVIAGKLDKVTPPEASCYMAQALPNARVVEFAGAAHTPFLSHPEIFVEQLTDFLHG